MVVSNVRLVNGINLANVSDIRLHTIAGNSLRMPDESARLNRTMIERLLAY
ncbi:MAG TPA: hypothetical protein VFF47_04750 [Nitrospirota bacterium]|nr:hypothetical protein [Nitrospirota bacterium]